MPNEVKAFELVSCIEDVRTEGDKQAKTIYCLEYSDHVLYLGTSESFIVWYDVKESVQEGFCDLKCNKQGFKHLGQKKPVIILKAASALDRLLALCDGVVYFLNLSLMEPVAGFPKLKGISYMCVNENPLNGDPFAIQVCVSTKKQLHIFNVNQDQPVHLKKQILPEPAVAFAMDGKFICAALATQYAIVNWETGFVQHLMPYDIIETCPLVKPISRDEFLLGGPNSLGIFVTTEGTSERAPLSWSDTIHSASYIHPYLVTMDREFITVYSILDQRPKQQLQFFSGKFLENLCGRIFLASSSSVYALLAVHWEKQVQDLFAAKKVSEALHLAVSANHVGISREQFLKMYSRLQQQAGFIELSEFHFDEAQHLFIEGNLDVRELISLYPRLRPIATITRSISAFQSIADVNQMCKGDENLMSACKVFLLQYLENCRPNLSCIGEMLRDVNTVLMKLYAESNMPELANAAMSYGTSCHIEECVEWLSNFGRHHALALLHYHRNELEPALNIWVKLASEVIADETFPGLPFLVDVLANVKDWDMVWNYGHFVLSRDQKLGVKMYINRPVEEYKDNVKLQMIVDKLQKFPVATFRFLEYVVCNLDVKMEKFHTHLGVLYVNKIKQELITQELNTEKIANLRKKFQQFLIDSSQYRARYIIGQIGDLPLLREMTILHGRLEEHAEALNILVLQLKDHNAAREHCLMFSRSGGKEYRQYLFANLLRIYLNQDISSEEQDELINPAIQLLNCELSDFDTEKVVQMIPDHWSIAVIDKFLHRALRTVLHTRRTCNVKQALAKAENVQVKFANYDLQRESVRLTPERVCCFCRQQFTEPIFAWLPGNRICHTHCMQEHFATQSPNC